MDIKQITKAFENMTKTFEEGFKEMSKALKGNAHDKNLPRCVNKKMNRS